MEGDKSIVRNSKGEIVEFEASSYVYYYNNLNLKEIISIPNNIIVLDCSNNQLISLSILPQSLLRLYCENNNIKQLPDLRECRFLEKVICDICCLEDYMLEMKNVTFELFC